MTARRVLRLLGKVVAGAILAGLLIVLAWPPLKRLDIAAALLVALAAVLVMVRKRRRAAAACACRLAWTSSDASVPLVVVIHGTFARHASWLQPDSDFRRELEDHLGPDVDVEVFCWSGANSHLARGG